MTDSNVSVEIIKEQHRKNRLINKLVLFLGIIVVMLIFVGIPIGFLIKNMAVPVRSLKIDIRDMAGNQNYSADECEDCNKLVIRDINSDAIVFEEALDDSGQNRFREYLINKAKQGNTEDEDTIIKLFKNRFINRLVDISLDISESVVERNKATVKNKAEINYAELLFKKFNDYMEANDGFLIRDTINVRFYGPHFKDNPCNTNLLIKYTEPEWKVRIIYSKRDNRILFELGDKLPSEIEEDGLEMRTNDKEEIYKLIKEYYIENLGNPNRRCHFGTYLIPHLTKINDDITNKQFSDYEFVLLTDGEFYFSDTKITDAKEVYVEPDNFEVIESYLANKENEQFRVDDSSICKNPTDSFIIIGMDYKNNLSYRKTVQQFYRNLLAPCRLIFENL